MRYNGEVYHLYSFTEADNEEEEDLNSEFINACSTQSAYSSYQPIREPKKKEKSRDGSTQKNSINRSEGGRDTILRPSTQSVGSKITQKSLGSKGSNLGRRRSRQLNAGVQARGMRRFDMISNDISNMFFFC